MSVGIVKSFLKISYKKHLAVAFVIRLLLILYGEYHDRISEVPYTDIDYKVFTDAARHIVEGNSPYTRQTYRYSPLIAVILVPNVILHFCFGKIVFSVVDLFVAIIIKKIVLKNATDYYKHIFGRSESKFLNFEELSNAAMCFWLYNPMAIVIATRGNGDSIAAVLVLGTVYFLLNEKYIFAGILHGLAIHFRLYPLLFSLTMFMHLSDFCNDFCSNERIEPPICALNKIKTDEDDLQIVTKATENEVKIFNKKHIGKKTIFKKKYLYYLLPNYNQMQLILSTVLTLSGLLILFYRLYGYEFLFETYIYHFIRKDTRHNFSVFFYLLYLTADIKNIGMWQKVLTVVPQLVLILVISVRYGLQKQSLCFGIFAQAIVMVTYNTVMTSQYFIWFLSILPVLLWQLNISFVCWLKLGAVWGLAQASWLLPAYMLEFKGQNTFLFIWLQSIAFFSANVVILSRFITNYCPFPRLNKID